MRISLLFPNLGRVYSTELSEARFELAEAVRCGWGGRDGRWEGYGGVLVGGLFRGTVVGGFLLVFCWIGVGWVGWVGVRFGCNWLLCSLLGCARLSLLDWS